MSTSNAWAEFAGLFARTRQTHLEHANAKAELKGLMPEDVKEAIGHGLRANRSKSGSISFDKGGMADEIGSRSLTGGTYLVAEDSSNA